VLKILIASLHKGPKTFIVIPRSFAVEMVPGTSARKTGSQVRLADRHDGAAFGA
jgi:hypothetical protein